MYSLVSAFCIYSFVYNSVPACSPAAERTAGVSSGPTGGERRTGSGRGGSPETRASYPSVALRTARAGSLQVAEYARSRYCIVG